MSDDIKNEFKDFIAILCEDICKGVLLEELEKVNTSLNNTSDKYNKLYANYKSSIEQIKQGLSKLDNTNKNMNLFTNSINANSKAVNESLKIIKNSQEKVLEDIIGKNKKALEKYKVDIQKLNLDQRNEFITALKSSLNESSKKYINELSNIINGSKMNQTLSDIIDVKNSILSTNMKINELKSDIHILKDDIVPKNQEENKDIYNNILNMVSKLDRQIEITKRYIKNSNDRFENQLLKLEAEIKLKNTIIIGMCIAILFIILIK
ncbi:hypothetical protein [Intestinibacter bartlettii]|uniref:Uncharacterized protein n=1 Tax=Intestinibacter bartlettii TaxID=261299 RepID=A0ABS6DXV4_9FIRM|nr:hypothetical protein [Intestinibacter bartlettii]MBU5336567.1 hypothetical protein [Intestinibacter bartlettii]